MSNVVRFAINIKAGNLHVAVTGAPVALFRRTAFKYFANCKVVYNTFYHGYCEDQRKAAFIILQQTHGYWKNDTHHYIQRA
jgi:hypothetical protein